MIGGIVYEERIVSKVIAIIFLLITVLMLMLFLYLLSLPGEETGWAILFYLILIVILIFIGVNFSVFTIRVTPDNLLLYFGIFKKRIDWRVIEKCEIVNIPWTKFGGIGIRISRIEGNMTLAYIVEKAPKVALYLKGQKYKMLVFSTNRPEELLNIIRQKVELYRE